MPGKSGKPTRGPQAEELAQFKKFKQAARDGGVSATEAQFAEMIRVVTRTNGAPGRAEEKS
ncbi:hypothetical protein [Reyranella sp.]|uniref:hypothetical protein n=1 Tax=Reyranella sp. TaxID=1929291 RepID=UPI003BAC4ACA